MLFSIHFTIKYGKGQWIVRDSYPLFLQKIATQLRYRSNAIAHSPKQLARSALLSKAGNDECVRGGSNSDILIQSGRKC